MTKRRENSKLFRFKNIWKRQTKAISSSCNIALVRYCRRNFFLKNSCPDLPKEKNKLDKRIRHDLETPTFKLSLDRSKKEKKLNNPFMKKVV
jgi:hypothetical protein